MPEIKLCPISGIEIKRRKHIIKYLFIFFFFLIIISKKLMSSEAQIMVFQKQKKETRWVSESGASAVFHEAVGAAAGHGVRVTGFHIPAAQGVIKAKRVRNSFKLISSVGNRPRFILFHIYKELSAS